MEGLNCGISVGEYIGADFDEPIECDSDVTEHDAIEDDNDEHDAIEDDNDDDSADEVTIGPYEALDCCLRLSSFFSL